MSLTEAVEHWVHDASRMGGAPAAGVVVTEELFAYLADEQRTGAPTIAGLDVQRLPPLTPELREMIEIPGPDRVCVYVGTTPGDSPHPPGLDPAMPVVFVPLPPHTTSDGAQLEMYNRLRWYGLGPDEVIASAG